MEASCSDAICTSYQQLLKEENNTSRRHTLQLGQFIAASRSDPYQRLGIDRSMLCGEKTITLGSLKGEFSSNTDSLANNDNHCKMNSIDVDSQLAENRTEVEEFENVSLTTGHLNNENLSDLPSIDQMNSDNISHIGERFVAHNNSRSSFDAQRRRRLTMALVIGSVAVVTIVIIIIGKVLLLIHFLRKQLIC